MSSFVGFLMHTYLIIVRLGFDVEVSCFIGVNYYGVTRSEAEANRFSPGEILLQKVLIFLVCAPKHRHEMRFALVSPSPKNNHWVFFLFNSLKSPLKIFKYGIDIDLFAGNVHPLCGPQRHGKSFLVLTMANFIKLL